MSNQIAVVYVDQDGNNMRCRKAALSDIESLSLDADERYLRVAIIKDAEGLYGGPFVDNESGHDCIGLAYNPKGTPDGQGSFIGRLLLTKCNVGPDSAQQSSWTNPGTGLPTLKPNKAIDAKLNAAMTQTVQFARYEGNNVNQLENQAMQLDVTNDAVCELV